MSIKKIVPVILAAGKGTRMMSNTPKVLHTLASKTMLEYALDLATKISNELPVVVLGFEADKVEQVIGDRARVVIQKEQ